MVQSALLNVMVRAAHKAARGLKRDFGEVERLQVSLKGPGNFVTAADRRAEEILRTELAKARPGNGRALLRRARQRRVHERSAPAGGGAPADRRCRLGLRTAASRARRSYAV